MGTSRIRPIHASLLRALLGAASGVALAGTLLVPAPARAQDSTPESVQLAIEATDRRIEQAEAVVSGADNPTADSELAIAQDLQRRARESFSGRQYAMAQRLTFEARRHADRAIALIKSLPDPDRVQIQLERTRELIERARERVADCDVDRARGLVRAAREMQSRAEAAVRDGRYLVALQLTMGARERVHRAMRVCRVEENIQESAERALRRTDDVIERVREHVDAGGGEPARQALARASDLQARARQDFRSGQFEACLRETQSARAFAYRAARISGSGSKI